jgi:hypothetical protein
MTFTEEDEDNMWIMYGQMDDIRQYIIEKDLPGAKEAVAYLEDLDKQIFQVIQKLANSNIYEILIDYNLDPAIQNFMLLYQGFLEFRLKFIIHSLEYAYKPLNLKLSDVVMREEPAYMERARQTLEKFARDDQRYDAMIKRSKQRIARNRAKK